MTALTETCDHCGNTKRLFLSCSNRVNVKTDEHRGKICIKCDPLREV